ncbi:amidohydrolase [Fodinicurvata sp. EGI_FJ10296]|uniref:amidohydrolase n=1 Tax=Fodinicurvata sp. EGI_FJ10296 TaxID=3231908 RepID=UPI003453E3C0
MPVKPQITPWLDDLTLLRRDLHAHPELGFEETRTSEIVARSLTDWGIEVTRGIGGTGVVGTLANGPSNASGIGLRADMDALAMPELETERAYRSTIPGKMHACGHDGHTVMLLAAARYLAETRRFSGTVHFIFQPAEEGRGGAQAMVDDGLLDRFPMRAVYGLHNMPGLDTDQIAVVTGPQLASSDTWRVVLRGEGTHGAKPHLGRDPVTAAGHFLTMLHTIVARRVDPLQPAVVSACSVEAGDPNAANVIPGTVTIQGTARAYSATVRDMLEHEIGQLALGIAATTGMTADYTFIRRIAPVINDAGVTSRAIRAAAAVVGEAGVVREFPPSTAGDDFSVFSSAIPGSYVWLGNGPAREGALHHNGRYDFNDTAIATGASYWAELVEQELNGPLSTA